jgi:hypothetical protein
MLTAVTATIEPADAVPPSSACNWSLVDRDEFGPITGPPGLFTARWIPVALAERDQQGRRLATFAPDGDLL